MSRLDVFKETLDLIENDSKLRMLTQKAIGETTIIDEHFTSKKRPYFEKTTVSISESLTLQAAERFCREGKKTAVLNFANPVEPGGGVWRGANAQEEYLCRASNLYRCLDSKYAAPYYLGHREQLQRNRHKAFLASDKIIYSKNVTVIRTDGSAGQDYTDDWYQVDVITCAAPCFFTKDDALSYEQLYPLFCKRIRNIFESAIENKIEVLILGAFGCGAFHNPPSVVAKAFRDVLLEDRYKNAFTDVIFAIKRTDDFFCENIMFFEEEFLCFPEETTITPEGNKRRFFM